ncbi:antibiotic biosynthesis monooxygenase [Microtetraspora sp. NBRC 13810]|uniref:antibiotic biosynthesis monooxygenase n=1 Tax=Microtetraspora sp. NBRC 13810 TaxID=3030990 RepID=UPI00249FB8D0|nr:antibiotic biosynthesis monooxygenase [Microtetraspora sp. NBRC 13810]GLW08485.1 antibiotic biosynthesis monooxygenase [Microtetraspora sp. NBRC 13810]
MIMRTWRGWTRSEDADAYEGYLLRTGYADYTAVPGNRGACFTRREEDGRTEFLLTSLWDSWEAVRAFAGDEPGRAVFYPEDDRYLVDRELTVGHYTVFAQA